jgi:zinc transport system substrate-binding protein
VEKAISTLPARVRKVNLLDNVPLISVTDQLAGTEGTTAGEVLGNGADPHVWLAPTNMQLMAGHVRDVLASFPGADAATISANATTYSGALSDLDSSFRTGLAHCASTVIVTSHRAFGYLAKAYGLQQIAISGISPSEEPSAKTLEAVAKAARQHNVSTIFFENNLPSDLSTTIAREIGARTAVLDPVESLSSDQITAHANYVSVMQLNLAALQRGLGCK